MACEASLLRTGYFLRKRLTSSTQPFLSNNLVRLWILSCNLWRGICNQMQRILSGLKVLLVVISHCF